MEQPQGQQIICYDIYFDFRCHAHNKQKKGTTALQQAAKSSKLDRMIWSLFGGLNRLERHDVFVIPLVLMDSNELDELLEDE